MVSLMVTLFSGKMLISTRCIRGFMSNLIIKSWKNSPVLLFFLMVFQFLAVHEFWSAFEIWMSRNMEKHMSTIFLLDLFCKLNNIQLKKLPIRFQFPIVWWYIREFDKPKEILVTMTLLNFDDFFFFLFKLVLWSIWLKIFSLAQNNLSNHDMISYDSTKLIY